MEAKFAHLDSILFGIKENLTDGQYLDVMTTVHDIYKWCESRKVAYEEDDEVGEDDRHLHIASEDEEDIASEDEPDEDAEPDEHDRPIRISCGLAHGRYEFCTNSLDAFVNCSNFWVALELVPILADLVEGADPTTTTYQLQTTPAIGELNESEVMTMLRNLLNINRVAVETGQLVALALFDFAMRHFNHITINPGLVCSMYSTACQGATNQRPGNLIKFNVAEPPFVLFKRALRPFVEIAPEEIRTLFNIVLE